VKEIAKLIEGCEASAEVEDLVHQTRDEDLSQVDTGPFELMGREKPEATLWFGMSLCRRTLSTFTLTKVTSRQGSASPRRMRISPTRSTARLLCFGSLIYCWPSVST
jgi:hypothetical protein